MTLKALGVAGAVAFGSVVWMATDRSACDDFSMLPIPEQAKTGVLAGEPLVVSFIYPQTCPMRVLPDTVRWRMIDSAGHMFNFEPDRSKLLFDEGGNPVSVLARTPEDATPGEAKFRVSMQVTKNPFQEYTGWSIDMQPNDVPFTIVGPTSEQKEQPNG